MATNVATLALGALCYRWANGALSSPASACIDENGTTYDTSNAPVNGDDGFYIVLPTTQTIMAFGFVQTNSSLYRATSVLVEYSYNNTDWNTAYNGSVGADDWEQVVTPVAARYWRWLPTNAISNGWRLYTLELWVDEYVNPQPPDGALTAELQQKVATQYPQLLATWALLQGAPTNCDPLLMLACITLWNNYLLNSIIENGTGGGTCLYVEPDPNNQAIWDKVDNVDTDLASGISAIAANDNANMATILANDNGNTAGLISHINDQTDLIRGDLTDIALTLSTQFPAVLNAIAGALNDLSILVSGEHTQTRSYVHQDLFDPVAGVVRQVNDNTNAVELSINGNVDAAEAAILAAIGDVQADTDDIQNTLSTLPSNPAPLRLWPGIGGVTWGTPVVMSAPTQITAACHGVSVEISAYPPGQSRQPAGSTIRHKGIAWLSFVNDAGDFEQLEQIQHSQSVILTRQLEIAAGLAVYCKPGCTLIVTPFTIDAL